MCPVDARHHVGTLRATSGGRWRVEVRPSSTATPASRAQARAAHAEVPPRPDWRHCGETAGDSILTFSARKKSPVSTIRPALTCRPRQTPSLDVCGAKQGLRLVLLRKFPWRVLTKPHTVAPSRSGTRPGVTPLEGRHSDRSRQHGALATRQHKGCQLCKPTRTAATVAPSVTPGASYASSGSAAGSVVGTSASSAPGREHRSAPSDPCGRGGPVRILRGALSTTGALVLARDDATPSSIPLRANRFVFAVCGNRAYVDHSRKRDCAVALLTDN